MTIFDWLNQINYEKKKWDSFTEDEQRVFNVYMINRWLSMDENLIEIVNYFQKYSIGLLKPKDIYTWYCNIIPKKKRFNKYIKGKTKKYNKDLLDIMCKHYETSKLECKDYIDILTKDELTSLLELYGIDKKQIKKVLK
jgi:hypothetical protein